MRSETTRDKLETFLTELGRRIRGAGRLYLTGGGTAVWFGWRQMTIDIDLKADPEPAGFFEALATLKDELDVNIELASPGDLMPEVPGWQERSLFIARFGQLDCLHLDPYSQALAKLERSHVRDLADVEAMARLGLIERSRLLELFDRIAPRLHRYPAVEPKAFRASVETFCSELPER